MSDKELRAAAVALLDLCKGKKLTLATAESCTGGLVAAMLSEIPGSSLVLDRGFVTYSKTAKQQMLDQPHCPRLTGVGRAGWGATAGHGIQRGMRCASTTRSTS